MSTPIVLPNQTLDPSVIGGKGVARSAKGPERTLPPIKLPNPGKCPHDPTHTILLFDNSGSVCGGNDSIGRRFDEAAFAVERVGRRCRCKRELVSIVHFDVPTSHDVTAARLDRTGRVEIEAGLAVPSDGAGISEMGNSLARANELANQFPHHLPVLVAFTDFELFDSDVAVVFDTFCDFPGVVHGVVLRAEPPEQLVEDSRVTVTRVTYESRVGTVAHAVFDALTATRLKGHSLTRGGF